MLGQITFFRESRVPKQCTGSFKLSNAWTKLWNKLMEDKEGVKKQNFRKGFEKNEPLAWGEFSKFRISLLRVRLFGCTYTRITDKITCFFGYNRL